MEKVKLYLQQIDLIANSDIPNKHEKLAEILTEYFKYCKNLGIEPKINFDNYRDKSYIIESTPLFPELNEDDIANAFIHLQEVIQNNQNGLVDGITLEEAKLILDWDIQNARTSLAKTTKDFINNSLSGACGYSQSITLTPLIIAGLKVTINSTYRFKHAKFTHAFGTVKIPIKENNQLYYKQYLIDATYRQFFSTIECNDGIYYDKNSNGGPAAGYFVCKTEEGRKFAKELLQNGYIELTKENAKIYGNGFELESLKIDELDKTKEIENKDGTEYIEIINTIVEKELDPYPEELIEFGDTIIPPGLTFNR